MTPADWPTLRAPGVNWLLCQCCGDFFHFAGHAQLVAHAWAQGIDECEDCLVEQMQQARSREQHPSRFWQRKRPS
jgi:hypothetical protein